MNLKKLLNITVLLIAQIITQRLAHDYDFLWVINLPISAALSLAIFDLITEVIDFEEIKSMETKDKHSYRMVMAILAAGFAIATAIFLK